MVRRGVCPGPICGVQACLHLTSGSWGLGLTQTGAQQGGNALRVLSSVTVDDDGVQGTETITLQQRHQSLERTRLSASIGRQGLCLARARVLTWSGSLSEDTERCRLAGMVPGPLRIDSSATPRCRATSRALLRVAVAVRPRKQPIPRRSRNTCVERSGEMPSLPRSAHVAPPLPPGTRLTWQTRR